MVQNLLITLIAALPAVSTRGKKFLQPETPSEKSFGRPYLCKNWALMEHLRLASIFQGRFIGVLSAARNVLLVIFSGGKSFGDACFLIGGGDSQKPKPLAKPKKFSSFKVRMLHYKQSV